MKTKVLSANQTTPGRKDGPSHPPKNSVVTKAETITIAAYSPTKKSPNFIPEYSLW